jgi:glycosyltransferase involved in cell wall biosynthesis
VPLALTLHDYSFRCAKWILMYEDRPCSGPGLAKCWRCSVANYGLLKGVPTLLSNWTMARPERRLVDLFIPVSRAVAVGNDLAGQRLPFEVIPNFLPDPGTPAASEELAALAAQLPAEPYLLFVGAFGRHKGFGVLLKAYAALQERLGETATPPLVLIGYETGEFPLERTLIPPRVTVFKHWPHAAVMAAWERCLLGVVPSVWPDPCPTVAMEAMSAGRAVAASDIGGLPDLVSDGQTGLLLPPDDAGALADGLARLLADDAWRAALGAAGRAKYEQFRAATVVPRIEQAYRRLSSAPD